MTGAPSSPVYVCNLAADHMRVPRISSVETPTTDEEHTFARHYDHARRKVLRMGMWNFAKTDIAILRSGTPTQDYTDSYALPNDYIKFVALGGTNDYERERSYDIRGRYILMDNNGANSIRLIYIKDVTNIAEWDALALDVFALQLALDTVYAFTGKKSEVERLDALIRAALPDALSHDGQERPPTRVQYSKYLAARRGLTSPRADYYDIP